LADVVLAARPTVLLPTQAVIQKDAQEVAHDWAEKHLTRAQRHEVGSKQHPSATPCLHHAMRHHCDVAPFSLTRNRRRETAPQIELAEKQQQQEEAAAEAARVEAEAKRVAKEAYRKKRAAEISDAKDKIIQAKVQHTPRTLQL
jgi:hypothetical protein